MKKLIDWCEVYQVYGLKDGVAAPALKFECDGEKGIVADR